VPSEAWTVRDVGPAELIKFTTERLRPRGTTFLAPTLLTWGASTELPTRVARSILPCRWSFCFQDMGGKPCEPAP